MMFRWTEDYSVRVETLDRQHEELFKIMDELCDLIGSGGDFDATSAMFREMARRAVEHFQTEEAMMAKCGFPGLVAHKREHENISARIERYLASVESGEEHFSVDLMHFLQEWISHHVLETDARYSAFLANCSKRCSANGNQIRDRCKTPGSGCVYAAAGSSSGASIGRSS